MNYTLENISTLLIANRGEIACRIIRTAKQLGLKTVAVYTEADAAAAHPKLADVSVLLPDNKTSEGVVSGYLDIQAIVQAAKDTHADAIHPGYGFLSENADFSRAVAAANLKFVGPEASHIEQLGDKVAAKAFANELGVNTLPTLTLDAAKSAQDQVLPKEGWPWLIKAAAGGGGRGMRVVENAEALFQVIKQAQTEAQQHFGNPTIFLEKYLPVVRHIEVQIFADHTGQVHHLWHRDCTAQRRHQKVIEEAPADNLPEHTSTAIIQASCALAKAANYLGAGTVEFLVDPKGNWYFLEMNTRLQVEHPATEAITHEDLVAWQLLVADGQPLPPRHQSHPVGHAIELRICAENPAQQFMPTTGTITHIQWPSGDHIRVDHALYEGLDITPNFDSLLAKLIVWGPTRAHAMERLQSALACTFIEGIITNLSFHRHFLQSHAFRNLDFHTTTLSQLMLPKNNTLPHKTFFHFLAAATLIQSQLEHRLDGPSFDNPQTPTQHTPWHTLSGWRHQGKRESAAHWFANVYPEARPVDSATPCDEALYEVTLSQQFNAWEFSHSQPITAKVLKRSNGNTLTHRNEHPHTLQVRADSVTQDHSLTVFFIEGDHQEKMVFYWHDAGDTFIIQSQQYRLTLTHWHSGLFESDAQTQTPGSISAEVPGIVKQILVQSGDTVKPDTVLLIIESMKIEQEITAKQSGRIAEIFINEGDRVEGQQPLLKLEEA
jgi:3-methylcrotonyl-CoA carboxylase alpha subunit